VLSRGRRQMFDSFGVAHLSLLTLRLLTIKALGLACPVVTIRPVPSSKYVRPLEHDEQGGNHAARPRTSRLARFLHPEASDAIAPPSWPGPGPGPPEHVPEPPPPLTQAPLTSIG
jgi:hypothetical protein